MVDPAAHLLVIGLAFLLAGSVKGVIGMGLPTVAVGVLSLTMLPAQAAALVVAPSLVTNTWQSIAGPSLKRLLRRMWSLLIGVCVGIWLGAGLLTGDTQGYAVIALGVVLMLYALLGLANLRPKVPPAAEPWLSPLIGITTGLVAGATGIFVIPAVPYLQALDMERDDLVQALGIAFVTSTVTLGLVLAGAGVLHATMAGVSVLAIIPAVLGMAAGQFIRSRASPAVFRTCFFVGMLALGAHLASRALF